MKKIIFLTLLCNIAIAQTTENKFASNITNVTVFLTGAELTHEAKVKVKKGKNTIKLTGLSAKLDNRTINLDPGSPDITVLYLNTETNYFKNGIENNAVNALKDSIEFYADKLSLLNFEQEALKQKKN